jgi:hypothetical protein
MKADHKIKLIFLPNLINRLLLITSLMLIISSTTLQTCALADIPTRKATSLTTIKKVTKTYLEGQAQCRMLKNINSLSLNNSNIALTCNRFSRIPIMERNSKCSSKPLSIGARLIPTCSNFLSFLLTVSHPNNLQANI